MSRQTPQQLPLAIGLRQSATFNSFIPGPNQQLVSALKSSIQGTGEDFFYLWGAKGSGKSHLLQAGCALAEQLKKATIYLPLGQIDEFTPEIFTELEHLELVCIDDIQMIAGIPGWEQALFHLFNRLRERNRLLLVAADLSPSSLGIALADLKSRLAWGACYQLHPLNDKEKLQLLMQSVQGRGMTLSMDAARYILHHTPRNMDALQELIEQLDQRSLVDQRKLTIPFVRKLMFER